MGFGRAALARLSASGRPGWAVFAAGAAGAILLIVAEFSKVLYITVVTATCEDLAQGPLKDQCVTTGTERHHGALIAVGVLLLAMAWGAAVGRSRPAAAAMVILGIVPIGIAAIGDIPDTGKTGAIGADFSQAKAHAGAGIPLEIGGGALGIAGGLLGLRRRREDGLEPDD